MSAIAKLSSSKLVTVRNFFLTRITKITKELPSVPKKTINANIVGTTIMYRTNEEKSSVTALYPTPPMVLLTLCRDDALSVSPDALWSLYLNPSSPRSAILWNFAVSIALGSCINPRLLFPSMSLYAWIISCVDIDGIKVRFLSDDLPLFVVLDLTNHVKMREHGFHSAEYSIWNFRWICKWMFALQSLGSFVILKIKPCIDLVLLGFLMFL